VDGEQVTLGPKIQLKQILELDLTKNRFAVANRFFLFPTFSSKLFFQQNSKNLL
jgi:hypothetical protein